MAYGLKYTLSFKNRIQFDIYRTEIWQKDFVGDPVELTYAEDPCKLATDEGEVLSPIKSVSFTLNILLLDNSISLLDFYSDDDEAFRVDHYFESDESGGGTEQLLFTGYLNQDGVSEPLTDRKHVLSLKVTDGLALLKSVKWNEADPLYYGKHPLHYFIRACLEQTGLYNTSVDIDMNLPLRLYANIFENTTDDRGDDPEVDVFGQTVIDAGIFQSTDNTWDDCYSILEKILTDLNASLCQADGAWNIVRTPEYELFSNGEIPGTQYHFNGSTTDVDPVTLEPLVNIYRDGPSTDSYPVEEDQAQSLQRPYKYILNTFTYNTPPLIIQQDLQLPAGATPFDTDIDGDLRYDRYSLATYFPNWIQRNGDTSFLEVVTDTSVTPEQEVGRYINKPPDADVKSGVQFNPITVSEDDSFNFSVSFDTLHDDGFFWVYFRLLAFDGRVFSLNNHHELDDDMYLQWDEVTLDTDWYSEPYGVYASKNVPSGEWTTWNMFNFSDNELPVLIPADGVLLIEVDGNSHDNVAVPGGGLPAFGSGTYTTYWKDINLRLSQYVNESTQIAGHTHKDTGISTIKTTNESDLFFDDSPRYSIAGTLFTNEITNLNYTDTDTSEETDLTNVYFTRTHAWHRASVVEDLRLGNIIAYERLKMRYITRLIIEGTFRKLRYQDDKFISILCLFQFDLIADKAFLAKGIEIDYMNASYRTALLETYSEADDLDDEYLFQYFYKTTE